MSSNQRTRSSGGRSVDAEVQRLFRKENGKVSSADFLSLRNNYGDVKTVEAIQTEYLKKYKVVMKRAKKFARLIREKYGKSQYPFHMILQKAHKYKKKHTMTEDEFTAFQRIYEQELAGQGDSSAPIPITNMGKILGDIKLDSSGQGIDVKGPDYKYLQEILKLYSSTKNLHAQVVLQAMQYKDSDYEAISGEYRKEFGHNPSTHIHPVIAALFFPKIDTLEHHFLYANIAGIVKSRYEKAALKTKPDYLLFYSLVTDPNDVVCDSSSPMKDLLNRTRLQHHLWNAVLKLRNGQYYDGSSSEFISNVEMCRLNKHDTPDLVYGRYDGTVLKRLLSAFSFRPTIISTTPIVTQMYATNPYSNNIRPAVRSIPMINLRINGVEPTRTLRLKDSLQQTTLVVENNRLVQKNIDLIYSRGCLMFFVDRRAHYIQVGRMEPFNMANLPVSVAGFERINPRKVSFDDKITVRGDEYTLRSIVAAEITRSPQAVRGGPGNLNPNVVIGSSAAIVIPADLERGIMMKNVFHYDPLAVMKSSDESGKIKRGKPITAVPYDKNISNPGQSLIEMGQTRGIIFVYQLKTDLEETSGKAYIF
jgi:hypothetical protein